MRQCLLSVACTYNKVGVEYAKLQRLHPLHRGVGRRKAIHCNGMATATAPRPLKAHDTTLWWVCRHASWRGGCTWLEMCVGWECVRMHAGGGLLACCGALVAYQQCSKANSHHLVGKNDHQAFCSVFSTAHQPAPALTNSSPTHCVRLHCIIAVAVVLWYRRRVRHHPLLLCV